MSDIKRITNRIVKFRNERDWKQFHGPKELAIDIAVEAAEVLEHFQWKSNDEIQKYLKIKKKEVSDELADVLHALLLMANDLKIDLEKSSIEKLKQNAKKYPVEKSKGKPTKYTDL